MGDGWQRKFAWFRRLQLDGKLPFYASYNSKGTGKSDVWLIGWGFHVIRILSPRAYGGYKPVWRVEFIPDYGADAG